MNRKIKKTPEEKRKIKKEYMRRYRARLKAQEMTSAEKFLEEWVHVDFAIKRRDLIALDKMCEDKIISRAEFLRKMIRSYTRRNGISQKDLILDFRQEEINKDL